MAAQFKVGSFQMATATGNQAITGVGFVPKALLIWGQSTAGAPPEFADFTFWNFGMSDGTTSIAFCGISADNAATTDTNRSHNEGQIIEVIGSAGVLEVRASLSSFDADGFTLNYTAIAGVAPARYCVYVAIGGSDVDAKVGVFDNPISATPFTQSITGVGFTPSCILFAPCINTGTSSNLDASTQEPAIGWTDGTRNGFSAVHSGDGHGFAITSRRQKTTGCIGLLTTATLAWEAELDSFDADGFTVNWIIRTSATAAGIYYLALAGVNAYAGTITQPTSTGTQAITGVGFQPSAVLFQSVCGTANGAAQNHNRHVLGASDGSAHLAAWQGDQDSADPTIAARYFTNAKCIAMATEAATGSSSTLDAAADVDSLDADGFTLDWTTADATARQVLFLALGGFSAGGGNLLKRIQLEGLFTGEAGGL